MTIQQFKDEALAHFSYAIVSGGEMAIVDPSRNPKQYYLYAEKMNAKIVAVFETHPHADFVSSHLQIHKETKATIYVSKLVGADYPHASFDDGDSFTMQEVTFSARNTPGHSPDSISILAEEAEDKAIFTGDTLFIGNVGRPDLRENAGNMRAKREKLAKAMCNTMKTKYNDLPDETIVYPAHGAGSLCGKNMSKAASSTIGQEKISNWAFREQTEEEFVAEILKDQPMIPHYFGFDVDLNKTGAENFLSSIGNIPVLINVTEVERDTAIVDIRLEEDFKKKHLPGSYNIMGVKEAQKLETWLGAIIQPEEPFYLVVASVESIEGALARIAKIGYEKQIKAVVTLEDTKMASSKKVDVEVFRKNPEKYTIVDIRNPAEVENNKPFAHSFNIPLHELRERVKEIPTDKPIVVHCAAGYRSAAGSSIVDSKVDVEVLDLGDAIKGFL